jgi:hypothetical protein
MKKMFTLLFAVGLFTMAQAQPGTRDNRQNDRRDERPSDQWDENDRFDNDRDAGVYNDGFGKPVRHNGIMSPTRARDMEIARINRAFDIRIHRVRSNFYMSRFEKQRQVRFLEEQRKREIRKAYVKFSRQNRYDDYRDFPERRY